MKNKNITVLIYTTKNNPKINKSIENAKILTNNIILVYPDSSIVETVRETGIRKAKTDWVLVLDADEKLSLKLAEEIKQKIIENNQEITHYKIPRKNIFGKIKWLKHGGWWPDYQIRLINKNYLVSWPKIIHSSPIIKGKTGFLKNPIYHYFHGNLSKMVEKTIIFENIEAELLRKAGKKVNIIILFKKFFGELWRRMFKYFGFLDGKIGVIESIYQAFSKTITYLFLYEKNRSL